jgi:hypothetical protein
MADVWRIAIPYRWVIKRAVSHEIAHYVDAIAERDTTIGKLRGYRDAAFAEMRTALTERDAAKADVAQMANTLRDIAHATAFYRTWVNEVGSGGA